MNEKYKNDYEENDDSVDESQVEFLKKKQRELITSTIDYNLESLANLIDTRAIDLAPKYQRRFRWDAKRKSKLIESFLMNVPIPPIFLNEDDFGKYSVIDGKQRLSSISDFLSGRLPLNDLVVFKDLNGLNFFDLPTEFQNSLKVRNTLRAIIILRQSDKDIKYEVFQRLNTGGVRLNAQEIRNSAFTGILNDRIIELSESKSFHKMLGIKSKVKSRLYQEMKDVELVLRFFALKDNWNSYSGGLKKILDSYMDENKHFKIDEVNLLEKSFIDTIKNVELIFGDDGSYRRWLPEKGKWKQQVSAPLYDAQMFACYNKDQQSLLNNKNEIIRKYKMLFTEDEEFMEAIGSSTAAPARFSYRTNKMNEIIQESI